jgi:ATP-dependent Lhr-like helicase
MRPQSPAAEWSLIGDYANDTLHLLLNHVGLSCDNACLAIEIDADIQRTQASLNEVGDLDAGDLDSILANVENMLREKWDWALPESLLMKSIASVSLNISTAIAFAQRQA